MEGRQYIIATVMITIVMMLVSSSRFGAGESHSKHVPYDVQVPKEICLQVSACAYLRWWWIYCKWITRIRCTTIYVKEIRYRTECLDGWSGGNCDKPICNRCMPGYTCVAPDKCECMSSGGACTSVPCSTQISCFPGTCISGSCRCPTHFAGDDCLSFGRIPDIESCEVTLQDDNKVLAKALCGYKNIEPTEVIINSTRLSQIYMHMEAKAPPNIELPPSSDLTHIKFPVKLGVANAGFKIYKNGTFAKKIECHINRNDAKDYHKCDQRESGQSLDLEHGSKIVIAAFASLGGTKEGSRITDNDNSHFSKVTFTGDESWRKIVFRVDTKPPVHCFTTNCNFFPIQLERDVTSESEIKAEFHGWDDKDSGIKMFHIEVYLMNLSPDDQFEKLGKPIVTRDMLPNDPDFNHFIFICIKSGVYSVELTVYDGANNKAKARNIFVYTGSNKLETNPERPVQIESAKRNNKTGEYWLTDEGFHMRENMLSISWEGHFVSEARFSDEWSKPVRPWGAEGIDDERRSEDFGIGLRTIGKMRNLPNGITNYSLAYYVDEDKDGIAENYTEHVNLQSTECSHDIDIVTSKLGSTIGIVLIAYDVAGGSRKETFKVRIDTTAPTLTNWSLLPNDPDIYTSQVAIQTMDKESGIDSIRFKVLQVLDGSHEVLLKSGEAEIIKKSPPHLSDRVVYKRETFEKPCENGDGDCYCTAYRSCFSVRQFITIDHCWIDRQVKAKNGIAIDFEVLNQAGLTTGVKRLWLSNLEELHCRPANKLTTVQIVGVAFCTVVGLILLSAALALLVRIYIFKKPTPAMMAHAYSSLKDRVQGRRAEPIDTVNELYITGAEDVRGKPKPKSGPSYKGGKVKLLDETSKINFISEDDVQVATEINKGSLLIISKGFFSDGTSKLPVAVKSLKNGASEKDVTAMNSKAEFLAALPTHDNIVKVFGLIKSNRGHMIVMEYCDASLKSWLAKISDVTPDILDDMLSFAINISSGVEHLHANKIVHRRVAIRNVLLVRTFNQYVAKLIGFGPANEDEGEKASVPIKWLAPETLSTISKKNPVYSEKSDSWSFGITLWEIYTLGKLQPYPDMGSSEAKNKIISGKIMECPQECPPDIYEKVMIECWSTNPKERPNFSKISRLIENFKRGEDGAQTGYYASEDRSRSKEEATDQSRAYYTDGS